MKRFFTFLSLCLVSLVNLATGKNKDKPNIIFILIDDQRYDFLSFLKHPWIKTPNIDKLASGAMFFDNAFVTSSLSSPSRASIMTGKYAHAHKVVDNDTYLSETIPIFPVELQKSGYKTGFIGKWHMGGEHDMPRPGFNHWVSFPGQGEYLNPDINVDGKRLKMEGYMTDILTDYAVEYIKKSVNDGKPYFLYLSHKAIHENFTPAPRHKDYYKGLVVPRPETFAETEENYRGKSNWLKRQRNSWHGAERDFYKTGYGSFDNFYQLYSEAMLAVDESVGEITKTLTDLGEIENTIIVYYSDNGYMMGEHGLIDKRVMYEESIRVPAFVYWPMMISKPERREELILNIDLAPTFLELAGGSVPASMHGKSFAKIIKGESIPWRKEFLYEYFCDPNAVQTPTIKGLRTNKYSYMTYEGVWDSPELYDMENDPKQQYNLLGHIVWGQQYGPFLRFLNRQDPKLYEIVKELDDKLKIIIKETD